MKIISVRAYRRRRTRSVYVMKWRLRRGRVGGKRNNKNFFSFSFIFFPLLKISRRGGCDVIFPRPVNSRTRHVERSRSSIRRRAVVVVATAAAAETGRLLYDYDATAAPPPPPTTTTTITVRLA